MEKENETINQAGEQSITAITDEMRQLVEELVSERLKDVNLEAYRQGLNERIDNLLKDLPPLESDESEVADENPLPHYSHRSIWDA